MSPPLPDAASVLCRLFPGRFHLPPLYGACDAGRSDVGVSGGSTPLSVCSTGQGTVLLLVHGPRLAELPPSADLNPDLSEKGR